LGSGCPWAMVPWEIFRMNWTQVLVGIVALVGGFLTWDLNERSTRAHEDYVRREARYSSLVSSLSGFTVESQSAEQKGAFLSELNLCWLYCSDGVIRRAYAFLDTVSVGQSQPDDVKQKALGEFMVAVRRDLLEGKAIGGTDLTPEDFRLLRATR
jgi:hypothetical protein